MAALAAAHGTARETQAHPQEHDHQQQDSNAGEGGQVGKKKRISALYTVKKGYRQRKNKYPLHCKKGYRQRKNKYPLHCNKRLANLFYSVGLHDQKRNLSNLSQNPNICFKME